jgi:hypothetical protein
MEIVGIRKKYHGIADYCYVPLVLFAPTLVGFEKNKLAANLCRAFSLSALSYTLCTKASWGLFKLMPYRVHAGLDVASGVLALAACALPQIKENKKAKDTFITMGITGLLVGGLSLLAIYNKAKKH